MAQPTAALSPHNRATALTVGHTFSCEAGRHTVALTAEVIAGVPVYKVTTSTGSVVGQRVDALCASFATEEVARLAARHLTYALRADYTPVQACWVVSFAAQQMLTAVCAAPLVDEVLVADVQRAVNIFTPRLDLAGVAR